MVRVLSPGSGSGPARRATLATVTVLVSGAGRPFTQVPAVFTVAEKLRLRPGYSWPDAQVSTLPARVHDPVSLANAADGGKVAVTFTAPAGLGCWFSTTIETVTSWPTSTTGA